MTTEPKFRSDIAVTLDAASVAKPAVNTDNYGDMSIAHRAWVERPGDYSRDHSPEAVRRVIAAMMRGRHGSPFEGGYLSVYVEAPAVVWWEWCRHRSLGMDFADFGFNLESGRYKVLEGEFYVPPPERSIMEPDGFKPMRPALAAGDKLAHDLLHWELTDAVKRDWEAYETLTARKIGREVARLCLPFSTYYAGYVSGTPRSWLSFFSLRRNSPDAKFPTFPQWEIEQACIQCEKLFAERWPITYDEFVEHGRVAP